MQNRQKGAISALVIGVLVVVIAIIIGIGYWWNHSTKVNSDDNLGSNATSTEPKFTIGDPSTTTISKTTKPVITGTHSNPTPTSEGNTTTSTRYHNGTYGLTLGFPASFSGFRTYETAGGPSNLGGTIQIHFIAPGETSDAFVVNVFSKAQWNAIRTQENYAHLNTSNIGEGNYLGENFTWIYSDTVISHNAEAQAAFSNAVFY